MCERLKNASEETVLGGLDGRHDSCGRRPGRAVGRSPWARERDGQAGRRHHVRARSGRQREGVVHLSGHSLRCAPDRREQVQAACRPTAGEPISEDCLSVNVWSPANAASAPVIVFIHGGGFTSGSARSAWYQGERLAARGVTMVTIQYRVGALGWLDVSEAGPEYAQSMNNGLLDQMAGLRWVRNNIARFGGDASNVTLVGESAGAISISALMGIPEADSLYDRLILQSGTAGTVATRKRARDVSRSFAKAAGVKSSREVLTMSSTKILSASSKVYATSLSDTAFHPVVDGQLLKQLPADRIASANGPTAPVIIGTTLDEARYWLYFMPEVELAPREYHMPWLRSLVGKRAESIYNAYKRERPDLTQGQLGLALVGDVGFRMPAIRMAESLRQRGVDVRMYLATVKSIAHYGRMGSPHAVELPFVFGTLSGASDFVADNPANQRLSPRIQDLWVSFARDGRPKSGNLSWNEYDTDRRSTMILDHRLRNDSDPYPLSRKAWGTTRFDGTDPTLDRLTPLDYPGSDLTSPEVAAGIAVGRGLWPA